MKKLWKLVEKVMPGYALVPLIFCFAYNCLVYEGAMMITKNWTHYDLTMGVDRAVPFVPWWIYIYFICYAFWAANYVLVARVSDREQFFRFVTAELMSKTVCLIFFLVLPTTNVRPAVTGTDFASDLMRMLYTIDAPANLFPSIHCLVSWFCWIGIRGNKRVPAAYRIFSLVFALAVCASTQFTKQHYIVDVAGGLLLAEGAWWLAARVQLRVWVQQFFTRMNNRLKYAGLE